MKKPVVQTGDPRTLKLLDVNARFMRHETFQALVENIRRDGHLTQLPFVWLDPETGVRTVLSGNHRVQAAIEAGLTEIDWQESDDLPEEQQRIALQLSHNSISGEDDPTLLKSLYDSLENTDWRLYSGLDDKTLDMLAQVEVGSLSEANLDFTSVMLMFLPDEYERAAAAFDAAKKMTSSDQRWLAPLPVYEQVLDSLATAHGALKVGNVATALMAILTVFEAHLEDLRSEWLDPLTFEPKHTGAVPIETLFGDRTIPADAGAIVAQALEAMVSRQDVDPKRKWQALERWAADYLAGA